MSKVQFTHLHTHSPEGSLLDGFMRIDKAIAKAKSLGMDALGISDHGTMAAHDKFYKVCKDAGIHPVLGMEAYITINKSFKKENFEKAELIKKPDGTYIYDFMTEEDINQSPDGWLVIENVTPLKQRNELLANAKMGFLIQKIQKSLPAGDSLPEKKATLTRMINAYIKSEKEINNRQLCIKADTTNRDFFSWFPRIGHLLLIAKNNDGYQNLLKLNAIGQLEGFYGKPRVDFEDIKQYGAGIVATTACFPKGTMVKTQNGLKEISKINSEDYVLTHTGRYMPVVMPTTRPYSGSFYTIQSKGGTFNVTSTHNHQYLTIPNVNPTTHRIKELDVDKEYFKELSSLSPHNTLSKLKFHAASFVPEWKTAEELKVSDTLLSPIDMKIETVRELDVSFAFMDSARYHLKSDSIPVSENLMKLLGLYAAEGSLNTHTEGSIVFTIDRRKPHLISFIEETIADLFGIKASKNMKKDSLACDVRFNSIELYKVFSNWFQSGAGNKSAPDFVKFLEPELQLEFFKGFVWGDGYCRVRNDKCYSLSISTISKQLVDDLVHILHRNWINPCQTTMAAKTDRNGVNHQEWYSLELGGNIAKKLIAYIYHDEKLSLCIWDRRVKDIPFKWGGTYYIRHIITSIEESSVSDVQVYCMNVDQDHSFVANGVVVHNCLGSITSQLILRGRLEEAKTEIQRLVDCFDEVFLEIQPSKQPDQWVVNNQLIAWSKELGLPLIATTDAHMVEHEELSIHEALTHIGHATGDDSDISVYDSAYLMTPEEILAGGIPPEALQNAYDLSHRCQVDFLEHNEAKFPTYEVPGGQDFDSYLSDLAHQGLFDIFLKKDYIDDFNLYKERLAYELKIIADKQLSAYFVIVWDYISWAKNHDIYVGPGRGRL